MTEPLETAELLAFSKIAEVRSMSRAAAELGVPRATLGRRLARLEERLGVRLIRRTTRSLVLSDAGEVLLQHAQRVLEAAELAASSVQRKGDGLRGDVRVSVPPRLDASFQSMLFDFVAKHPDVRLHVQAATRLIDLRRDGYDVAIRAARQLEPGLVARPLGKAPLIAVASPSYLREHGTPKTRADLAKHRCLMGFARGELPETTWPSRRGKFQVHGAFFTNDMELLCEAAARGLGIAMVPRIAVEDDLQAGRLVHVLADVVSADSHIAVVYAERELMPPQVRAFIDAVLAWGKKNTLAPPRATQGRTHSPKRRAT